MLFNALTNENTFVPKGTNPKAHQFLQQVTSLQSLDGMQQQNTYVSAWQNATILCIKEVLTLPSKWGDTKSTKITVSTSGKKPHDQSLIYINLSLNSVTIYLNKLLYKEGEGEEKGRKLNTSWKSLFLHLIMRPYMTFLPSFFHFSFRIYFSLSYNLSWLGFSIW